jgi:arginine-tRNA-protein transferase
VHWLRFEVDKVKDRTSHKRIRKRNANFRITIEDFTEVLPGHAALHARYRDSIDFDGAWTIEDCLFGDSLALKNVFNTKCISIFDKERLIAIGYFDLGEKSAASILHFFDPEYRNYSLGKFLILLTIDYLCARGYEFYYPGYVVEGVSKMNYKLFLGKEHAQYFDPDTISWKPFEESILVINPTNHDQELF